MRKIGVSSGTRCGRGAISPCLTIAVLLAAGPGSVSAETLSSPSEASRDWHAGLNIRTDFGTHPIRLDGGVRFGELDVILVVDPMFWTDFQVDLDLLVDWQFQRGWSLLGGWRWTGIALAGGMQSQQKSVIGVGGRLPELWSGRLRGQFGLEFTILWAKHGGGVPVRGISFASGRDVADHLNFGLFLRFEYARAL